MKRILAGALALIALVCALAMPVSAGAVPQSSAVSTVISAVSSSLGKDTCGAAVLLYENATRTVIESYGYADLEERVLTNALTAFELGELSGIFVYLTARELLSRNKLYLDASIEAYLPADFVKKLDLEYTVTLQHLLEGTAGFEGRTFDLRLDKPSYTFDSLQDALEAEIPKQTTPPGTYHSYSPFSIGIVALMIEYVTGQSYAEYVQETLLTPLGMTHTHLDPRRDTEIEQPSLGFEMTGEGSFAAASRDGRSYGGIWPANGAISTLSDMQRLVEHLLSTDASSLASLRVQGTHGVFDACLLDFVPLASGGVLLQTQTLYFGASLALDPSTQSAMLVMTNTAESTLLGLPASMYGGVSAPAVSQETEALPELNIFEGTYAPAHCERHSLVGKLQTIKQGVSVSAEGDMLLFGDMTLRQIAPGIFADANDETGRAVLQFLYEDEEVRAVLSYDGESYLPISALEHGKIAQVLKIALLVLALYFLAGGILSVLDAIFSRLRGGYVRLWRFVFPWLFGGLQGIFALWQYAVAVGSGSAGMASFYTAMSILSLIACIGTIISLLFAFLLAFTERGRMARVVHTSVAYLLFLGLCIVWCILPF